MGPPFPSEPNFELMDRIIKDFGSYDIFKRQFNAASEMVEASRMVLTSLGF